MKKLLYILAVILLASPLTAQVVKIHELNAHNELIEVKKPFIVDINSMLRIDINKEALLDSMAYNLDEKDFPREQLNAINYALRLQQQTLNSVLVTGSRQDRLKALDQFRNGMIGILTYLSDHQKELEGTQFYQDLNSALESVPNYKPFFDVLNKHYDRVTSQYADIVSKSSARFKLGGWLNTPKGATQFHIQGFDSLTANGITEVPRFITSIPPSEVQAYNQARVLADSLKNNADDLIKQMKTRAQNSLEELETKVTDILESGVTNVETEINSLANNIKAPFVQPVSKFKQDLNNFKLDLVRLEADVKNMSFGEVLTVAQQAQALIAKGQSLKSDADALYNLVKAQILQVPSVAQDIKTKLTEEMTNTITQLKDLGEGYLTELHNTLKTFDEGSLSDLSETAAKFSSSTFALPLNSIPSEVDLDLRTVGQREPGDQVYFKATILNDSVGQTFNKTLFWAKYTMFHVGIHNSIRASLIFADKINGDFANSTNNFQLAPSYSVIFKVGTRKGMFYNKYLTPGLGINVSTLDFDNNNNPEIGIGITAAFFKDYLQVGYGMNMSSDDNFWMFGLRLPLFGWATGVDTNVGTTASGN